MTERNGLSPAADWVELKTTDEDWAQADPALLGNLLAQMHLIRGFEECVLELAAEGLPCGGPAQFERRPGRRRGRFDRGAVRGRPDQRLPSRPPPVPWRSRWAIWPRRASTSGRR
ncbi:hypothetical protein [Rhodanobacter lindaniclasticus]